MVPTLLITIFLALSVSTGRVLAEERVTVLRVGRLIDGSGGEPITDAVIVIKGKRIEAVGKFGEVKLPKGVKVIQFKDKTAMPGLVDTHAHYKDWQGDIYLAHGVTTAFDIGGNPLTWSFAQKEGIDKGKIVGPRLLIGGRINGQVERDTGEGTTRGRTEIFVKTPEQAREQTKALIARGVDFIKALEELTTEDLRAIVEIAKPAGWPVITHSINGAEAVLAGVEINSVEHSHSVAMATVGSEEGRKKLHAVRTGRGGGRMSSQEIHSFIEDEGSDRVIQAMVGKKVCWSPTLATAWRAFSTAREKFHSQEMRVYSLASLRYIPPYFRENTKEYFAGTANLDAQVLYRIQTGHKKLNELLRRFAKAGGKLQTGSDPNSVLPGLALHWEMELLVEAGLKPMETLMAATKNPAECAGREKEFGTVAPGRFADLLILSGNPLENISATREIFMVYKDGEARKPDFRAEYRNPLPRPEPDRPVPEIERVTPDTVTQGEGSVALKITGRNFLSMAVVRLNGKPIPAEVKFRPSAFPQNFRRGTEINATIPPELVRQAGTYTLVVEHPGTGGATSNVAHLVVKFR